MIEIISKETIAIVLINTDKTLLQFTGQQSLKKLEDSLSENHASKLLYTDLLWLRTKRPSKYYSEFFIPPSFFESPLSFFSKNEDSQNVVFYTTVSLTSIFLK